MAHHSVAEFYRGAAAAVTNILATFPLNKLTSRQMYEGLRWRDALHTMREEGLSNLYRGCLLPLLQKGVSMGIMYGTYDLYFHLFTYAATGRLDTRAATDVPTNEASLTLRALAAIFSGSTEGLLAPMERMQTLLQHRHYTEHFQNTADVARKLWPYGITEYYRGASAILLRNGPSNAIFFVLREPVRNLMPAPKSPDDMPLHVALARAAEDAAAASAGTHSSAHKHLHPHVHLHGHGPGSLHGSSHPISAVTGADVHMALPQHAAWNFARDFVSGAVLGACISTLFYPLNTAKGIMQLPIGGPHRSVFRTLADVYRERNGWVGMYRGVGSNALRALLSWGIVNSSYGIFKTVVVPPPDDDEDGADTDAGSQPVRDGSASALSYGAARPPSRPRW